MGSASSSTTVRPIHDPRDRARFVDLPVRLHRGTPGFVVPLRITELETLDPDRNPFYTHARIAMFLAERDGVPVGRIAVIDNDRHNSLHRDNLAFFGFFEAADESAADALLDTAERSARAMGRDALRGPVNPSMNDSAGLQIDAFDRPPFVMMPWNPPSYQTWIERHDFAKVKDLHAWMVDRSLGIPERFQRLARRARERTGAVVREVEVRKWDAELAIVQRIYEEAWERNWGEVAYTDDEFAHLAQSLKMIVDPAIALFLEFDGEVAGIALGLPDLNQVLARFDGRLFPFGIVPLLRRKRIIDQIRLAILGVLPRYRNRGFELILIDEVWRRGVAAGYQRAEMSWILEDNQKIAKAISAVGGEIYKTYRLYQKAL